MMRHRCADIVSLRWAPLLLLLLLLPLLLLPQLRRCHRWCCLSCLHLLPLPLTSRSFASPPLLRLVRLVRAASSAGATAGHTCCQYEGLALLLPRRCCRCVYMSMPVLLLLPPLLRLLLPLPVASFYCRCRWPARYLRHQRRCCCRCIAC